MNRLDYDHYHNVYTDFMDNKIEKGRSHRIYTEASDRHSNIFHGHSRIKKFQLRTQLMSSISYSYFHFWHVHRFLEWRISEMFPVGLGS